MVDAASPRRGRSPWPSVSCSPSRSGSATWISVELTDIIASLAGIAAAVVVLRFWKPAGSDAARERILLARDADLDSGSSGSAPITPAPIATRTIEAAPLTTQRVWLALFPYLLVIAVFSVAKLWSPVARFLASTDIAVPWPGLDGNILTAAGSPATTTIYKFTWLSTPGTLLLICGVIVAAVYRVSAPDAARLFGSTLIKLRFSALTVGAVLALAYVMNQSGQTITIGTWIAGTGAFFAYLSPILGWLGTAVTGSDTSANALFATLQQTAAINAGIDPTLLVAANTSGGVVGKMISPQNLAIAASAVGLVGRESEIFRKVIGWSLGLLLAICLLVGLQSSVLAWMLP